MNIVTVGEGLLVRLYWLRFTTWGARHVVQVFTVNEQCKVSSVPLDGQMSTSRVSKVCWPYSTLSRVVQGVYISSDLASRVVESPGNINNSRWENNMNIVESGYDSNSDGFSESICDDTNRNNIIQPLFKPCAPLIFMGRGSDHVALASCTTLTSSKTEVEYLTAVPAMRKPKSKQYGRTVMLTFALDGWYTAQQVAAVFRKKRENLPRIGVVILNEQSEHVNTCPEQFITGVFNQVDYVVPVITEEYLSAMVTRTPAVQSSLQCLDARWIKYIYTLMSTYYMRNGCINDKIRCIVPDSKVHLTQRHPVMAGPLFQVWVRASETEDLSHRILRSKF